MSNKCVITYVVESCFQSPFLSYMYVDAVGHAISPSPK